MWPADHLIVSTQHNLTESGGTPAIVKVTAVDSKGNTLVSHRDGTGSYSGTFSVKFARENSGILYLGACARFLDLLNIMNILIQNKTTARWTAGELARSSRFMKNRTRAQEGKQP